MELWIWNIVHRILLYSRKSVKIIKMCVEASKRLDGIMRSHVDWIDVEVNSCTIDLVHGGNLIVTASAGLDYMDQGPAPQAFNVVSDCIS